MSRNKIRYDPESMMTVGEARDGYTYTNSIREWPVGPAFRLATQGYLSHEEIAALAPRRLRALAYADFEPEDTDL